MTNDQMRLRFLVALLLISFSCASRGFIRYDARRAKPYNATFDGRSLLVDGRRSLFLSGSIHPPRVHEDDWAAALAQARGLGLNMVDVYVVRLPPVSAIFRPLLRLRLRLQFSNSSLLAHSSFGIFTSRRKMASCDGRGAVTLLAS